MTPSSGTHNIKRRVAHREPGFSLRGNNFYVENICWHELVEEYGTPLVCFSRNRLRENARNIVEAFKRYHNRTKVYYAYKANYFKSVLSDLKPLAGAEVISGLEMQLAREAGVSNENIVFNGVGKTEEELAACVENDVLVNVDSLSEIDKLDQLASKHGKTVSIGLRIHPELGVYEKDAFIRRGTKLGLDVKNEAMKAAKRIMERRNLLLKGLHSHTYSRQSSPGMHLCALESMIRFARKLKRKYGMNLSFLDIGGGLETRAVLERTTSIDLFAREICGKIESYDPSIQLYLEPGRYIVNDAAATITKVVTRKSNSKRKWLITDIATNFLIPVKNANFEVIPAKSISRHPEKQSFGGGICSSADVIDENVMLPLIKEEEYVIVLNCGAYTSVMSEQFVYPRPQVVYVDGSNVKTLWQRERPENVVELFSG
jgi:diaminopimelate decarboxylase